MSGITVMPGSASLAPLFVPDNQETPDWAYKALEQLTEEDVQAIAEFCRQEGWEAGWDDAIADTVREDARNPFHQQYLDGAAHELWRLNYRRGVREARASEDFRHVIQFAGA